MFRTYAVSTAEYASTQASVSNKDNFIDSDADAFSSYCQCSATPTGTPIDSEEAYVSATFAGAYGGIKKRLVIILEWYYNVNINGSGDITVFLYGKHSTNSGSSYEISWENEVVFTDDESGSDTAKESPIIIESAALNAATLSQIRSRVHLSINVDASSYSATGWLRGYHTFVEMGYGVYAAPFLV